MANHTCPECGRVVVETTGEADVLACLNSDCGWSGPSDEAAVDTASPFDVQPVQPIYDHEDPTVKIHLSKTKTIRLSAQAAENLAEALQVAARDARGHREPKK